MIHCCTFVVVADNEGIRKQGTGRILYLQKRWFADEVIIMCVRLKVSGGWMFLVPGGRRTRPYCRLLPEQNA
jgi:hypothetical protein